MTKPKVLKNGVRVHLIPFAGTQTATVLVMCKVGSRYEAPALSGASHFLEHLVFKGTKRRPTTLDISRSLDAIGAECNAYTGKDMTGFYVKADSEHVPLAIDMLHDMLFHSKFDSREMNRERRVIMEEINMYHDNPMMYAEDLLEQAMFGGSPLGAEIAGTHETMRAMPRAKLLDFRRDYYVPSRLVVTVAGKIEDDVLPLIERTFGKIPAAPEPMSFVPFGDLTARSTPRLKRQQKKTKQIQVALGFPSCGMKDERDPAVRLLAIILGGTMSSRLFISVRERRGLAYFVRAFQSPYEDVGSFVVQAGLDLSRLDLAMKTIFNELRSVKRSGVSAKELKLAKNYLRGKMMITLEDSSDHAEFYAKQELFLDDVESPEAYLKKFERVTAAQIHAAARDVFDESRLCVAGIGPFASDQALLKHFPL